MLYLLRWRNERGSLKRATPSSFQPRRDLKRRYRFINVELRGLWTRATFMIAFSKIKSKHVGN